MGIFKVDRTVAKTVETLQAAGINRRCRKPTGGSWCWNARGNQCGGDPKQGSDVVTRGFAGQLSVGRGTSVERSWAVGVEGDLFRQGRTMEKDVDRGVGRRRSVGSQWGI